jgi:phosphatidylinositol-3-phosphatase
MGTSDDGQTGQPIDPLHCGDCSGRLGHDQRYCLNCGTRRGPLPRPVAEYLGAMLERGSSPPSGTPVSEPAWTFDPKLPFGLTMPSPRAASVAVMAMLASGVILGSTPAVPDTFSAAAPVIVAVSPHGLISNALGGLGGSGSGGSGSGDNGSGGGGTQTVTVVQTTPAPASSGGSGGSSGSGGTGGATSPAGGTGGGSSSGSLLGLPPVKHLFLIMLSDAGFGQTFGPGSPDTYLSKTLPSQGKLLYDYYAVAGSGLANGVALLSGQGPTPQTAADCPTFASISPGTTNVKHQVIGHGCVYPRSTQTLPGQLTAKRLTWKAYVEGVDSGPAGQPTTCRRPKLGATDADQTPRPGDPYVTWRNPVVYFSSLIDGTACQKNDVGLGGLTYDLQNASTAPTLAYIVPGPCDDGNPQPCTAGATGGSAGADRFLKTVVPEIEQSAAYQDNGLIVITSDEAPQTGPHADSSACCNTPKYPNLAKSQANDTATTSTTTTSTTPSSTTSTTGTTSTSTTTTSTSTTATTPTTTTGTTTTGTTTTGTTTTGTTTTPPPSLGGGPTTPTGGGGQVGLLLISKYVKKNTVDLIDYYNHFSLLATIEDMFGLKKLGYAGATGLPEFDAGIFDGQSPGAARDVSTRAVASRARRGRRAGGRAAAASKSAARGRGT